MLFEDNNPSAEALSDEKLIVTAIIAITINIISTLFNFIKFSPGDV